MRVEVSRVNEGGLSSHHQVKHIHGGSRISNNSNKFLKAQLTWIGEKGLVLVAEEPRSKGIAEAAAANGPDVAAGRTAAAVRGSAGTAARTAAAVRGSAGTAANRTAAAVRGSAEIAANRTAAAVRGSAEITANRTAAAVRGSARSGGLVETGIRVPREYWRWWGFKVSRGIVRRGTKRGTGAPGQSILKRSGIYILGKI
jgi:hypothetical protein